MWLNLPNEAKRSQRELRAQSYNKDFSREMFPRRLLKGSLLARKPECNGQFRLSPTQSSHLFFWINPLNMDNGHFSVPRITNFHISSTPLYGHWVFVHCYLYMCVNCKHCILVSVQVMKDFYWLVRFYWRVNGKRQTWICITWTSFPFFCRLLFIITTRKSLVSCHLYPWELL